MRLLLLACLAAFLSAAAAQPVPLGDGARAVYERWVLATCLGDDAAALAAELRRYGTELAPAFARAIATGPSPDDTARVRAAAEALYERRQRGPLDEVPITGVTRSELARFRTLGREPFVSDQVRRFVTGYRANAVAALGIIGDPGSRALLLRLAGNPRDPLAAAARDALRRQREPR